MIGMMLRHASLVAAVAVNACSPDTSDSAPDLSNTLHITEAELPRYSRLAEAGDVAAATEVGEYYFSHGCEPFDECVRWLEHAAQLGSGYAMRMLTMAYAREDRCAEADPWYDRLLAGDYIEARGQGPQPEAVLLDDWTDERAACWRRAAS